MYPAGANPLDTRVAEGAGGQPSPSGQGRLPASGWDQVGRWRVSSVRAQAATVLARPAPPAGSPPTAWVVEVTDQALVLGSTQAMVDAPPGLGVLRRGSGGGAVLVGGSRLAWVELFVPAGDPLWSPRVDRATWWVGEAWAQALGELGFEAAVVHRGGLVGSPWSARVCFAGLGPGEVSLPAGKVVGISQRRSRAGAMFHCAAMLRWDPVEMCQAAGLPRSLAADLDTLVAGLELDARSVTEAFFDVLGGC